ncbi:MULTISPECIES: hypothetical protein [Streptomyces]|uniref:Uncharacterized protein n=1 Tax=Streptomyces griseus subsp. griseus (strain JCM 4626 / CBS 651.72 / NBRC 13350 / KCC S-0626 / ISP 5235) TaxID=455632 RepID=B1VRF4_STRGG|nr:hypothetical protein [Streptomyces griseus]BAG17372.1 hypothetical protein SGR_543 [Streptomyces griseus subsp. griseus NBRC 13350]SED75308.1 hypothetical protein SAMN04490359_1731 [Streptomyces griseus]SQA24656.1 ESX-1_EspG domain containing protein [Streptomyces griseus]
MPQSPHPSPHAPPRLLVSDHVAGRISLLDLPDGTERAELRHRHLAEHAGFLALPDGLTACVDDRAGELLVLDPYGPGAGHPFVRRRIPVAVPAEHLAADPRGRHLAVTTGLGRNEEAWTGLLTAVDLDAPDGAVAVRVRGRTGEPGVTVLGGGPSPLVVLRHREPGELLAHRHRDLMRSAPACPPAAPVGRIALPDDDGHGDAHDPLTRRVFAAAGSGVHRARREGDGLVGETPLPWSADGRSGGRGHYLRLDPVRRMLWSCVRGGPGDPGQWPTWSNDAWWHQLDTGVTGRLDLGPGLVFRLAVTARHIAYTRVHPDGDELVLLTAPPVAGSRPEIAARLPLPAMSGAPRPGGTPWDGVQRRAVAASPGGGLVAVSRGGHGEVHVFDADRADLLTTLTVPTPLDDGGHLALLTPGDGAEADPVGR